MSKLLKAWFIILFLVASPLSAQEPLVFEYRLAADWIEQQSAVIDVVEISDVLLDDGATSTHIFALLSAPPASQNELRALLEVAWSGIESVTESELVYVYFMEPVSVWTLEHGESTVALIHVTAAVETSAMRSYMNGGGEFVGLIEQERLAIVVADAPQVYTHTPNHPMRGTSDGVAY